MQRTTPSRSSVIMMRSKNFYTACEVMLRTIVRRKEMCNRIQDRIFLALSAIIAINYAYRSTYFHMIDSVLELSTYEKAGRGCSPLFVCHPVQQSEAKGSIKIAQGGFKQVRAQKNLQERRFFLNSEGCLIYGTVLMGGAYNQALSSKT